MAAEIAWNSASRDYGVVNFTQDSDLVVNFYYKSVRDIIASRDKGLPIYKDVVYVKIFRPGEMLNVIDRPADDTDYNRFKRQHHAFLDQRSQVPEGTPIDLLFPSSPSVPDGLRARGVFTIQQCANLTSHAIDTIGMGGQDYVNRAKKYLEEANSGSNFIKHQEEMKKKDAEIESFRRTIDHLKGQVNALINKMSDPTFNVNNPATGMPNPAFVPGYDAQTARINYTHVTQELAKKEPIPVVKNITDEIE